MKNCNICKILSTLTFRHQLLTWRICILLAYRNIFSFKVEDLDTYDWGRFSIFLWVHAEYVHTNLKQKYKYKLTAPELYNFIITVKLRKYNPPSYFMLHNVQWQILSMWVRRVQWNLLWWTMPLHTKTHKNIMYTYRAAIAFSFCRLVTVVVKLTWWFALKFL